MRVTDLQARLTVILAGRAAEQEVFGVPSSAAGGPARSDIGCATALAVTACAAYGLDDGGGLVWGGMPEAHAIPDALRADPALASRVRILLDAAYGAARALLRRRISAVEAVAAALVRHRVLDGPAAESIVREHDPVQPENLP